MTEIGPHLLGRIPSPPDERDWKLADFLGDDAQLRDQAVALLKKTIRGYHDHRYPNPPTKGSDWGKALALLAQIGSSPAPPPPPTPPPSGDVEWKDAEAVLDQGDTGTCVGNGWAQWGNTDPVDDRYDETAARAIYYDATVFDGDPDPTYQNGSTVRSGAKAMQKRSRLSAYAFASSIDDVIAWLKAKGPVVFGTDWTDDMFTPGADGYIRPTGAVAGGHCYLAMGYLPEEDAIEFLNSWGSSWGLGGRFKMKVADVKTLFAQQGEACTAVELAA